MLQSVGGKQFVRSTEVVRFSECPLSEVPLYTQNVQLGERERERERERARERAGLVKCEFTSAR